MSLLHRLHPDGMPFKVVELATEPQSAQTRSGGDGRVERRSDHPDRRAAATPARADPDVK
jgi:hypothetical protein